MEGYWWPIGGPRKAASNDPMTSMWLNLKNVAGMSWAPTFFHGICRMGPLWSWLKNDILTGLPGSNREYVVPLGFHVAVWGIHRSQRNDTVGAMNPAFFMHAVLT